MTRRLALLTCLLLAARGGHAEQFSFDLGAYEKKSPFEWNGFAELKYERQQLNQDSALYRLNFFDAPRETVERSSASLELSASYRHGQTRYSATVHSTYLDEPAGSGETTTLYEAYLSHQPDPGLTLEAGKRVLKWGKGYAWNPVAFVERPKDPLDPELGREGFALATADWIKSPGGALKTVAFTPVILPTSSTINDDFGREDYTNAAAKLYLLYRDIDIDLMVLGGGSRPGRVGFDFAANLQTNFEVHGEWAYIGEYEKRTLAAGGVQSEKEAAHSYLLGLRYLTERDTTYILELYHNDGGYTEAEMEDLYAAIDSADTATLENLQRLAQGSYLRPNPMQNYLYLRVSQKEPFDLLYFTPALTAIANRDDGSYSLNPELLYTGVTNLELRLRASLLYGDSLSEFGEKANENKLELRGRYYF